MRNKQNNRVLVSGMVLWCLSLAVAGLSCRLGYRADTASWPVLALAAASAAAGAVYVSLTAGGRHFLSGNRWIIFWVLLVGVALRATMMFSTPIMEDDFYRYLWDGAVVAHGFNPYSYSPEAIASGPEEVPQALQQLAARAGPVFKRINHPHLTTIYPPVAQGAFALAYFVQPFSVTAWRLVLWCFDLAALGVLWAILRELRLPAALLAVYWWNPLLVKEIFNAGHMDLLALPFALGAVWLSVQGRLGWSLVALSLGVGGKLWPLALLPFLLRPWFKAPKKLAAGLLVFGLMLLALSVPVWRAGPGALAGIFAYSRTWEMNDALFKMINGGVGLAAGLLGYGKEAAQALSRLVVFGLAAAWVGGLAKRPWVDGLDLCRKCLLALAALFLLSPTQFPWYYLMLIPFLAVYPAPSLLTLTALLPLYSVRFYFLATGRAGLFDYGLVWLEYLPVGLMLWWEWKSGYRPVTAELVERGAP